VTRSADVPDLPPGYGPRHPLGPDVPLSSRERNLLAESAIVHGFDAAAIQAACAHAVRRGFSLVVFPAGDYRLDHPVLVPASLTLLGHGSETRLIAPDFHSIMLRPVGSHVRFTRMRFEGPCTGRDMTNAAIAIHSTHQNSIRIDHVEMYGFSQACFCWGGSVQVDHTLIHDCPRDRLGYGVCIMEGAHVLVADSDLSQCRHHLASNGALDWQSPARVGHFTHKPNVRPTRWELVHSHIHDDDRTQFRFCAVDTHPGMDGTFLVEANLFENLNHGVGIRDGSGVIRNNLFRNFSGPLAVGVRLFFTTHNYTPVENAYPHDVLIHDNRFENVPNPCLIEHGRNIVVDGRRADPGIAKDRKSVDAAAPDAIQPGIEPRLQPLGLEYVPESPA